MIDMKTGLTVETAVRQEHRFIEDRSTQLASVSVLEMADGTFRVLMVRRPGAFLPDAPLFVSWRPAQQFDSFADLVNWVRDQEAAFITDEHPPAPTPGGPGSTPVDPPVSPALG